MAMQQNRIVLEEGKVALYEDWTNWNGVPVLTFQFSRLPDGNVRATINDPEHPPGRTDHGPVAEVFKKVLHPKIATKYEYLFSQTDLTPAWFARGLYRGYAIEGS